MRTAALILLSLVALAAPAAAQQSPFAPLAPGQPAEPPPVVVAPDSSDDGLKTWQELMIFGAGMILLGGIAWAIVTDARRKAPVKESEVAHPGLGGPVKRNRSQKQRERARAKAKVARTQRKRNRGR